MPATISGVILSATSLTVAEGAALGTTFMVSLAQKSSLPVTIFVASGDRTIATTDQDTLTFPANTVGPQMVTVFGTPDDDTVDNSTLLTLTSTPDIGTAMIRVLVIDRDKQALVASPSKVYMMQGGSAQVGVRLAFRPAAATTVTIASPDPTLLTVTPSTLTFTADSTFSIPQAVTLTAAPTNSAADQSVSLSLKADGVDTVLPVPVVIYSPAAQHLLVAPGSLSLTEGGTPGTLAVQLTKQPAVDTVVTVLSSSPARATVDAATLTFTAANFSAPQTVTVTPVAANDPTDQTATVTLAIPVDSSVVPVAVPVTLKTNQLQAIKISPSMVTLNQGDSATFDVWLASAPAASVAVNLFSSNTARVTVTPPNLIFTTANYATHQQVTVQAPSSSNLGNVTASITLTSTVASSVSVPVTVVNTNTQALQVGYPEAPAQINMQETPVGGPTSSTTVSINLAYLPAQDVTVSLAISDAARLSASKSSFTFTSANGMTPQLVTLTSLHDADLLDNMVNLTFNSPGLPPVSVAVQILDVDREAFTVGMAGAPITAITTNDGAGMTSFDLGLTLPPGAPVPVMLLVSDPSLITLPSATATLSGVIPMTIPIIVRHDADLKTNSATVTIHTPDATLGIPDRTVTIQILDVDVQGIWIATTQMGATPTGMPGGLPPAPPSLTIHETDTSVDPATMLPRNQANVWVALNAQPAGDVTLTLTPSPSGHLSVMGPARPFTSATWNMPQLVTIVGQGDTDLIPNNVSVTVSTGMAGVADQVFNVIVLDDSSQVLQVTPDVTSLPAILEPCPLPPAACQPATSMRPTTGTFTVKLALQPVTTTTVTVTVQPDMTSSFGVSTGGGPPSGSLNLMFTVSSGAPGGYDQEQTVTVTALADQNTNNESAKISVSLPAFAETRDINVSSVDSNIQAIVVTPDADGRCTPGGVAAAPATPPAYTCILDEPVALGTTVFAQPLVRLAFPPNGNPASNPTESVTVASARMAKVMADPGLLSFTSIPGQVVGGWDYRLTGITLTPQMDEFDDLDENVLVTLSSLSMGDAWDANPVTIRAIVHDKTTFPLTGGANTDGGSVMTTQPTTGGFSDCRRGSPAADCTATYGGSISTTDTANGPKGIETVVTLQATPQANWQFDKWTDDCSGMPGTAMVTMGRARTCKATFKPILTVRTGGTGSGTVTSGGVSCGSGGAAACMQAYDVGSTVMLTATAGSGSTFTGWMEAGCPGSSSGSVTVTAPLTCTAVFTM